jgi:hypothetical protein
MILLKVYKYFPHGSECIWRFFNSTQLFSKG